MELKPIYRRVIGLLRGSFIPPAHIRYPGLIARHRQKLGGSLAGEKNRRHKILSDAGIRLGVLVSDIHGQAAAHHLRHAQKQQAVT